MSQSEDRIISTIAAARQKLNELNNNGYSLKISYKADSYLVVFSANGEVVNNLQDAEANKTLQRVYDILSQLNEPETESTENPIRDQLELMATESEGIKLYVIQDILDNGESDEELTDYIKKVIIHGCIEGVGPLMYCQDSTKFFIDYHEEILEILDNYYNEFHNSPVDILTAERLSWFSYETWIRIVACELGI